MNGENPRVLLLGDDTSEGLRVGQVLADALGSSGSVQVVAGFRDAREQLSSRSVDIAFLVPGHPEDQWMERFMALRAEAPAVALVVLRAAGANFSGQDARAAGADFSLQMEGLDGATLRRSAQYAMEHRRLVNELDLQETKMREFTGRIAHSLNNELSTILLHADLMRLTMESGAPMEEEDVDALNESARRAAQITKSLLGFSREA